MLTFGESACCNVGCGAEYSFLVATSSGLRAGGGSLTPKDVPREGKDELDARMESSSKCS